MTITVPTVLVVLPLLCVVLYVWIRLAWWAMDRLWQRKIIPWQLRRIEQQMVAAGSTPEEAAELVAESWRRAQSSD